VGLLLMASVVAAGEVVTTSIRLDDPDRRLQLRVDMAYNADSARSPLPLVVVSHPSGSSGAKMKPLLEQLARAGYLAVAPTHADSADPDSRPVPLPPSPNAPATAAAREPAAPHSAWEHRARDLSFAIRADWGRSVPVLAGRVDSARVAVVGQGLGASAALLLAGGTVKWSEGLRDERVKVVALLAPLPVTGDAGRPFGWLPDPAAKVDVPVLLVCGPAAPATSDLFPALPEGGKFLLQLRSPATPARGVRSDLEGVSERTLGAFLDGYLRSDPTARDLLVSGSVVAPYRDVATLESR
jgi:dienelactone hydrolase